MKLLVDAGNTRIKWAVVSGEEWVREGTVPVDQAAMLVGQLAEVRGLEQMWVSNVAGELVAGHIRGIWGGREGPVNFLVAQKSQCGVLNGYQNPAQLGSDRWAALVAAWRLVNRRCMVVNCGTAITIDALSAEGRFVGGIILPGPSLMRSSLIGGTSQLKPEQGKYAEFPVNTGDAVHSGVIQACSGAIERQYALLRDGRAPVLLTGGAAQILEASVKLPVTIIDNLVLRGLLLIAAEGTR